MEVTFSQLGPVDYEYFEVRLGQCSQYHTKVQKITSAGSWSRAAGTDLSRLSRCHNIFYDTGQ